MSDYFLIVTRLTDRRPAVTGLEFSHLSSGVARAGSHYRLQAGLTMKLIFSSILVLGHLSLPTASSATLIHYATMSGAHTGGQANVRREFHFSVEIWYWEHLCQTLGWCLCMEYIRSGGASDRLDKVHHLVFTTQNWSQWVEPSNVNTVPVQCFLPSSLSLLHCQSDLRTRENLPGASIFLL